MSAHRTFDQQDHLASLLRATGILNYSLAKPCHRQWAFGILATGAGAVPSPAPGKQYKRKTPSSPCHDARTNYGSCSVERMPDRRRIYQCTCTVDDEEACIEEFLLNRENSSKRLHDSCPSQSCPGTTDAAICSRHTKRLSDLQQCAAARTLGKQPQQPIIVDQRAADCNQCPTASHRQYGSEHAHHRRKAASNYPQPVTNTRVGCNSKGHVPLSTQQTSTGSKLPRYDSSSLDKAAASMGSSRLAANLLSFAAPQHKGQQLRTYTAALQKRKNVYAQQQQVLPFADQQTNHGMLTALPSSIACEAHKLTAQQGPHQQQCQAGNSRVCRQHRHTSARNAVGIHVDALPSAQNRHKAAAAASRVLSHQVVVGNDSTRQQTALPLQKQDQPITHVANHAAHVGSQSISHNHQQKGPIGAVLSGRAALFGALNAATAANQRAAAVLSAAAKRAKAAAAPRQGSTAPDGQLLSGAAASMVTSWYLSPEEDSEQHRHAVAGVMDRVQLGCCIKMQQRQQQHTQHNEQVPARRIMETKHNNSSSTWSAVCPSTARFLFGVGYNDLNRKPFRSSSAQQRAVLSSRAAHYAVEGYKQQQNAAAGSAKLPSDTWQEQQQQEHNCKPLQPGQLDDKMVRVAVLAGLEPLQELAGVSSIIDQLEHGLGGLRLTAKRLSMGETEMPVPLRQRYAA